MAAEILGREDHQVARAAGGIVHMGQDAAAVLVPRAAPGDEHRLADRRTRGEAVALPRAMSCLTKRSVDFSSGGTPSTVSWAPHIPPCSRCGRSAAGVRPGTR
ncbi:hypothetical protein GCM10010259_37910 [Streptomyces daghestanicus]|uniref:Uncharacterized protein n=1 Tax=Streptomyces daghestanicus TaxID=66885 RepID=A0ABQ3QAS9_9ACTN|nr:hypothetical protein GCM10010259_37910 [Streptomyces daghestanicus]GHI34382.1 hypothetical protein Sdagh_61120 [Streptomyces daghestanicus]